MKISIVVPVYNAEKYLNECIESIINQTVKNLEIILVDDGSTDRSGEICDDYANSDKRIIVIHKENEGVSAARNTGILRASGNYIQFVDSDDYLESDMCEILLSTIENNRSDFVICGYKTVSEKKVFTSNKFDPKTINIQELSQLFSSLYVNCYLNVPWNKLYKKRLIKTYYNTAAKLGEDILFNLEYMKNIKNLSIIPNTLYCYRVDNSINSASTLYRENIFEIIFRTYNAIVEFCHFKFSNEIEMSGICNFTFNKICTAMKSLIANKKISKSKKKDLIKVWCESDNMNLIYMNLDFKSLNLQNKVLYIWIKKKAVTKIYLYCYINNFIKHHARNLVRILRKGFKK